jgi:hypothetical protein
MIYLHTKNYTILIYFEGLGTENFGIFCWLFWSYLYISPFWYFFPRKIWQPWLKVTVVGLAPTLAQKFIPGANPTTFEFTYSYIQRQRCSRLERFSKYNIF